MIIKPDKNKQIYHQPAKIVVHKRLMLSHPVKTGIFLCGWSHVHMALSDGKTITVPSKCIRDCLFSSQMWVPIAWNIGVR